ncbi:winged helix DNA-binding protein [Francisellaceae bacterium]|nr:winged helix DNA-binding protein [Francisellaceae bacterium]
MNSHSNQSLKKLSHQWRRINALWYKAYAPFLKKLKITYTQAIVLTTVEFLKKPTKSETSQYMRAEQQSITRAINSLVEKNMLIRESDKNDTRFIRLSLTEQGATTAAKIQTFLNNTWTESLDGIQEQDFEIFNRNLDCIIKNMESNILGSNETPVKLYW